MNGKVYLLITLPSKQLFLTASSNSQKLACNWCVINRKHASAPQTKMILKVYDRYRWLSKCSEKLVAPKIRTKNEMGRKKYSGVPAVNLWKNTWRTKVNQVSTIDWICVPILLCINSAACHVLQRNYGMKLFRVYVQGAEPPSPSCFLPSPFGTIEVLSLAGPNKTTPLSSSLAHGPVAREQYRACVSTAPQGSSLVLETDGDPSSSRPPPAWVSCPSRCSRRCGGRDVFRAVRSLWQMICMIRMLATLMLNICLLFFLLSHFLIHRNIIRQHKVLAYALVFLASFKKFNVLKTAATT